LPERDANYQSTPKEALGLTTLLPEWLMTSSSKAQVRCEDMAKSNVSSVISCDKVVIQLVRHILFSYRIDLFVDQSFPYFQTFLVSIKIKYL
jgi:hypothetical protein